MKNNFLKRGFVPLFFFWTKFPFSFWKGSCIIKGNGFPVKNGMTERTRLRQKRKDAEKIEKMEQKKAAGSDSGMGDIAAAFYFVVKLFGLLGQRFFDREPFPL